MQSIKSKHKKQISESIIKDSRFKIDARFIDDNNNKKNIEKNKKFTNNLSSMESIFVPRYYGDEKSIEYEIKSNDEIESYRKRKITSVDYDDENEKEKKIIKNNDAFQSKSNVDDYDDNNKNNYYYDVNDNLKNLFNGKTENFSFGSSLFEQHEYDNDNETKNKNNEIKSEEIKIKNNNHPIDSSDEDNEDTIQLKIPNPNLVKNQIKSISFDRFFFNSINDIRLHDEMNKEEQFYSKKLIDTINQTSKERQLNMIKALSLRKKSSLKNQKTALKYNAKQKQHKRFILQQKRRKKFQNKKINPKQFFIDSHTATSVGPKF